MEAETTGEFRQMERNFERMFEQQRITQTNIALLHEKLNRFIGYNETLTEVVKNMNVLVHTTAIAVVKNAILHEKMDSEMRNINILVFNTAVATNAGMNAIAKFTEDMKKYMEYLTEEVKGYQMGLK